MAFYRKRGLDAFSIIIFLIIGAVVLILGVAIISKLYEGSSDNIEAINNLSNATMANNPFYDE